MPVRTEDPLEESTTHMTNGGGRTAGEGGHRKSKVKQEGSRIDLLTTGWGWLHSVAILTPCRSRRFVMKVSTN